MNSNEQLLFGVRPLLLYQADNLEHGVVFPCANMYSWMHVICVYVCTRLLTHSVICV